MWLFTRDYGKPTNISFLQIPGGQALKNRFYFFRQFALLLANLE
jgi:hypothetical protein